MAWFAARNLLFHFSAEHVISFFAPDDDLVVLDNLVNCLFVVFLRHEHARLMQCSQVCVRLIDDGLRGSQSATAFGKEDDRRALLNGVGCSTDGEEIERDCLILKT